MDRIRIILGIAKGIVYLHTNFTPPQIHRDIKSPNILIDNDLTPKVKIIEKSPLVISQQKPLCTLY